MALHFFNPKVAEEYGVNAAVLLQNLSFWIEKNKANDKNFHDGYYWTYNSVKAFQELFPYLSPSAISTALQKLEDGGIIKTGNYNKSAYDRTKWYAITDFGYSILEKSEMETYKNENQIAENNEPIPYRYTDNKSDKIPYNDIIGAFNETCVSLPKVQKLTNSRRTAIKKVLELLDGDYLAFFRRVEQSDFLTGKVNGFKATFDWITKQSNAVKIIEGNYDNRKPQTAGEWGDSL